jgi:lipopolysaccharide export LptBFGC system permease protein LptF
MSSIYGKDIKEYYINQLLKPDPNLSKIGRAKLISEAHHRIIWSLHNICFTLIGLSVFLSLPYSRKASRTPILWISCVILIISLIHFSVQNLASQQPNFIIGSYANLILSTILALYLYSK